MTTWIQTSLQEKTFSDLEADPVSLKQMQTPVIQTWSVHAGTHRAKTDQHGDNTHTSFCNAQDRQVNNLQHETTQVSPFFYLLHLENQARKLQTPNLILLFECNSCTK